MSTERRGLESFPSNDGGSATTDMADVTSATAAQGRASILINIFLTSWNANWGSYVADSKGRKISRGGQRGGGYIHAIKFT